MSEFLFASLLTINPAEALAKADDALNSEMGWCRDTFPFLISIRQPADHQRITNLYE